ncbi:hypothetical protein C2E23DRAFT_788682 [Lenzites betulinus]|nr:hypothetical protein C2E23DRAFT_788682 [Lenzites betulinus]
MPVLFRGCTLHSANLDRKADPEFIPPSLWNHVQIITFLEPFWRTDMENYIDERRRRTLSMWPESLKLAERWRTEKITAVRPVGEFLKTALQSMPRLHTIRLRLTNATDISKSTMRGCTRGVSMYVLSAMLSAPQLRHLDVWGYLSHPYDEPLPAHILSPPSIPLESLVYDVGHNDASPQVTGLELSVVSLLLERASATLRILELPSQSTPLHRMHLWTWPMLTKLSLNGERPLYEDSPPLVVALGQMPRLRELSLRFAEPFTANMSPPPIWPSWLKGSYAWPDLERVFLTHPHPDDEFYAHLPPGLQSLSLRCWPRHYKFDPDMGYFTPQSCANWVSSVSWSSEMLYMLRRIDAPRLTTLDVEYLVDAHDELLLRHIPSSYPHLQVLRIHRYRQRNGSPIYTIADCLRGLTDLRLLMIYLDFDYLPLRDEGYIHDRRAYYLDLSDDPWVDKEYLRYIERLFEALAQEATTLAVALPATLEHICFLIPLREERIQWYPFRIVREEADGGQETEGRFHVQRWEQRYPYDQSLYGFE